MTTTINQELVRNTQTPSEVKSFLIDAFVNKREILVWLRDEDRNVTFQATGVIESINEKQEIKFTLDKEVPENNGANFFFAFVGNTVVFRSPMLKSYNNTAIIVLPPEIKYLERRKSERKKVKLETKMAIDISYADKENGLQYSQAYIQDYSDTGLSFIVTKETLQKLDKELVILFKSSYPHLGSGSLRIVNIRPFKGKRLTMGETFVVGAQFV